VENIVMPPCMAERFSIDVVVDWLIR
jgi:hypothetical protein